jgi:hypothetical protein
LEKWPKIYYHFHFLLSIVMSEIRDEFLSEEDLDLATMPFEEFESWWNLWLMQAQITNEEDKNSYSHGVFILMDKKNKP